MKETRRIKLYGKNPVIERVKTAPQTIKKVYLQKGTDLSGIVRKLKTAGLDFVSVDKKWFKDNCAQRHTQGVMAEVESFEYTPYELILADCLRGKAVPVFLDGITDPQNLGSIIRSLACLGSFSIVLPEHDSAQINETVLRVSSGGENYVKIAKVPNIAKVIREIKEKGKIKIIGAETNGANIITQMKFVLPFVIVIGSEGKGIRPGVKKCLDTSVSLPMRGAILSYNASIATTLFCYEVVRQVFPC
ncbi:MAG: 23S rRNA (guanosine(2251)-2'-O)-methyltransferase RlmB [Candidatus Omnitrophota bacterium]|nr:23S rRNA (guanosine(2251)-2'-O)-methyltransferase RlmB [Candidatus Omnitrophota bacterium]MBU1894412.1 23S rRNA (guanosine(2251)-2'-O)-methyltransferase RlmB [Candidatus Omnitrophota bacterium]